MPEDTHNLELATTGGPDISTLARVDAPAIWKGFSTELDALEEKKKSIAVKDARDTLGMTLARTTRLAFKKLRLAVDEKRLEMVEGFKREAGKIDAAARGFKVRCQAMEDELLELEKFAEREEAKRKQALSQERWTLIAAEGANPAVYQLGDMSKEEFETALEGAKLMKRQREAQLAKEEHERLQREKAEADERERIRLENEKLRAEAAERAEREKQEREERERLAQIENERRAKEEAKRIEAERKQREAERAKHQAELDRLKAEQDRATAKADEERQKAEAAAAKEREAREKAEAEIAKKKAEEAAAEKERKRAELAAKKAPDMAKMKQLAEDLRAVKLPHMSTGAGEEALGEVSEMLQNLCRTIDHYATKL